MGKNKKNNVVSLCGLNCYESPAYIATINDDDRLREKTASEWNKRYQATGRLPVTKDEINCLSCLSLKEPVYRHCKECGVRKCGLEKGLQNCGECGDYENCPKIASLHELIPEGKAVCDAVGKEKGY